MFGDNEGETTSFASSWKKQKKLREHSSQTSETITYEVGNQTNHPRNAQCQTESLLNLMTAKILKPERKDKDEAALGHFLKEVESTVLKQLKMNNATVELYSNIMKARKGLSEYSFFCEYALHEKSAVVDEQGDTSLEVTGLSWSRSGASVAVSYGSNETMSWSEDRSYICLWNMDRPKLKLDEADQKLELESAVQTVQFHPHISGYVAAGLFSGVVVVWDLSKDEACYSDFAHNDPVTCLCWMENNDNNSRSMRLVSSSTDGKFIIWKFKKGKTSSLLKYEKEYVVSSTSIPRSFGVKGRGSLGVTCFCPVQNFDQSASGLGGQSSRLITTGAGIVVGLESGLVLKCSLELLESNPVTFVYEAHKGPVYSVDWSPFHRNIFLTCSTDQSCRIYHSLEAAPLREIRTGWVGSTLMAAAWSFTRPTLFYVSGSSSKLEAYDFTQSNVAASVDVGEKKEEVGVINCVEMNPVRSDFLATASSTGYVHIWRLGAGLVSGNESLQHDCDQLNMLAKEAMARD